MPGGSRQADQRTDVYQLGKMLYELLTGKTPALMELTSLPPGLVHIIRRATKESPDDRYQSLGELMDALGYYQRAKDPRENPRDAFENLVQQAKSLLEQNEYNAAKLHEMLAILSQGVPLCDETMIELFDQIPRRLFPALATVLADEFLPVLTKYAEALRAQVGGRSFGYAESVANGMKIVFNSTANPDLKKVALLAVMIAAVKLHRFAAMDVFDELLLKVKSVEDAMPIAEMLEGNADYYKQLADRIPADRLYHVIRDVRTRILARSP